MVSASERKNTPGTPSRNASGTKTTTGVSVEPTSGGPISRIASWTASTEPSPRTRFVWMFSMTTIASSMTRPIAAAIPPSVIRLKLR